MFSVREIQGSDGKFYVLPNPTAAKRLHAEEVTEHEMQIFREFFDGRRGIKTADRYKKIRNYILNSWYAFQLYQLVHIGV